MLLDYLRVAGVEVVNHARLDAYMTSVGCPLDTGSAVCRCESLTAEMLGDEPYTSPDDPASPAPWFDEDVPASGEFAGLMVLDMDGIDDRPVKRKVTGAVGGGGSIGPGLVQPRTIIVTALVLGSTCCGVEYGLWWLGEALAGCTGMGCGAGDCASLYTCCPPEDMDPQEYDWHRRTLRRVALVEGPTVIERSGDGCTVQAGECHALGTDVVKVEFILTAATPWLWTDPLPILEMEPPSSDKDCVTWCLSEPEGVECFPAVSVCPGGGVPVVEECREESIGEPDPGPEKGVLVGAASSDWARLETNVAPMTVRRSYNGPGPFPTSWEQSDAGAGRDAEDGRVSVWSAKPPLDEVAAGDHDSAIEGFLWSVPDGHPLFVTIWHEPDAKVRRGDMDAEAYLAAFRHFADIVHAAERPNTWVFWAVTGYLFTGDHALKPGDVYPGDEYVDLVAFDAYAQSPEAMFDRPRAWAQARGLPWGIAETGWADGPGKPGMIADTAAYAERWGAEFVCFFDSDVGGDTVGADPTPGTDPAARKAMAKACRDYRKDPAAYRLGREAPIGDEPRGEESLGEGGCGLCWPVTPDDCGKTCRHAKCVDPREGCGDPSCQPAVPPAPAMPPTCFCLPLASEQECFDLDLSDRPAWSDDVPMITVRAPKKHALRGLTIRFFERTDEHEGKAIDSPGNLSPGPSPGEESLGESAGEESLGESATCEEIADKERCNPHSVYHVQYVPPGGVLTLDGQIGRAMVECPPDTCESSADVYGADGAPPSWRPFDCSSLCICISMDVQNWVPGASIEIAVSGRGY